MSLKRDLLIAVGAVVVILIIVCFGATGLLARMSPAIEHVLRENDASLTASENIVSVLALSHGKAVDAGGAARFDEALDRLRKNVTEPEETAEIETVARVRDAALGGDPAAREETVRALDRLEEINRSAMHRANEEVQRLGWAGAWATVILCTLGFGAALVVTRRLERKIVIPAGHLRATLDAALAGDVYARCAPGDAQEELRGLMVAVNRLLDRYSAGVEPSELEADEWLEVTVELLNQREEPSVLIDPSGRVMTANRTGLERIAEIDGEALRRAWSHARAGEPELPVVAIVALENGWRLCALQGKSPGSGTSAMDAGVPPLG